MFKDLKEYQEITQLYHDSVNISEEQREINKLFLEADFTAEEIQYLDENFDELWESEFSILIKEEASDLTEEQINELVLPAALPLLKKGVKAVVKRIPKGVKTGIKDTLSGAKTVVKKAIDKAKPVVKKVGKVLKRVPGIALPAAAIGGVVAGVNKLRNIGKEKREKDIEKQVDDYVEKRKNPEGINKVEVKPETKTETKPETTETKPKKMHSIEKKNRARLGDEKVDKLKAKQVDFKKMRKGEMSKADFIKAYPNSITAQKAKGLRDHTEWDAYDMVLEYLFSTEQVSSLEEANYVMMQLDEENIQEIVGAAVKGLKAVGRFGAKGVPQFAALAGTTAAIAPTVGKLAYKAKETVGNVVNKVTNFDPVGDARKKYQDKKATDYEKRSGTTKKDGYFR